jgi:hypothetical protein
VRIALVDLFGRRLRRHPVDVPAVDHPQLAVLERPVDLALGDCCGSPRDVLRVGLRPQEGVRQPGEGQLVFDLGILPILVGPRERLVDPTA